MFKGVTAVEEPSAPFKGVTAVAPASTGGATGEWGAGATGEWEQDAPTGAQILKAGVQGARRTAYGLKKTGEILGLNKPMAPEGMAPSKDFSLLPTEESMAAGEEDVKRAGTQGKILAGGVEAGIGMIPAVKGAQALNVAGKVLPKAVQFAVPAVADIAANAATGYALAPEDKGEAAAWSGGGAALGHVLPKGVDLARKGFNAAADFVMPGRSAAGKLSKYLGPEETEQAIAAVREGVKKTGGLPQTTAGLADNAKLAGIERGIPGRGLVDLGKTRRAQEEAVQTGLTKLTSSAGDVDVLAKEAADISAEGAGRLNRMPLGRERKSAIVEALGEAGKTNEVIGNPEASSAVRQAIKAINNPDSSTGILTVLAEGLEKRVAANPKLAPIRDILMNAADERSKFIASSVKGAVGEAEGALRGAKASKVLRGEYLDEAGGKIKDISDLSLNRSLTKPGLSEDVVKGGRELSEEVRRANLYKNTELPTEIPKTVMERIAHDPVGAAVSGFFSGGKTVPLYAALRARDVLTKRAIDKAVADPVEFLRIFDAKKATGEALAVWEKKLARTMRPLATAGGAAGREIAGEQNAP